jgi:hypothetical protein
MVRYTGVLAAAGLCLMSLPQTTGHAWYMLDEEHCGLSMVSPNMAFYLNPNLEYRLQPLLM